MCFEEWRSMPMEGYEGLYAISNFGRVKSCTHTETCKINGKQVTRTRIEHIHKTYRMTSKYARVQLCKNSKSRWFRVDYLVALAFVPNPNNYTFVSHKDGDMNNNNADNLSWVKYYGESLEHDEIWRPIPQFEDLYYVSSLGRVRSIARVADRTRHRGDISFKDAPIYGSKLLKPYRYIKHSGIAVYHLHRRCKPGPNGQTDVYVHSDDLVRSVFPELA